MTSATAELAVVDTSVYVDNFRFGRFETELLSLPFLVRVSAVVVAELARGARSRRERRFVDQLARGFSLAAPSDREWVISGRIVRELADHHGFEIHKLRELHFDVLIALTARRLGAHLITCNRSDFEAIRQFLPFKLTCW